MFLFPKSTRLAFLLLFAADNFFIWAPRWNGDKAMMMIILCACYPTYWTASRTDRNCRYWNVFGAATITFVFTADFYIYEVSRARFSCNRRLGKSLQCGKCREVETFSDESSARIIWSIILSFLLISHKNSFIGFSAGFVARTNVIEIRITTALRCFIADLEWWHDRSSDRSLSAVAIHYSEYYINVDLLLSTDLCP